MSNSGANDPIRLLSEPELEEYLQRDSEVSQRYHELGVPSVPAALDQRILKQARQARKGFKPAPRWRQWGAPLAIAASALLAVTVLLRTTPRQRTAAPVSQSETVAAPGEAAAAYELDAVEPELAVPQDASPAPPPAPAPKALREDAAKPAPPPESEPSAASTLPAPAAAADASKQATDASVAKPEAGATDTAAEERSHYDGGETRNYATYNPQRARDDQFLERRREESPDKGATPEKSQIANERLRRTEPQGSPPRRVAPWLSSDRAAGIGAAGGSAVQPASALPDMRKLEMLQADRLTPPRALLEQLRELTAQGRDDAAKALYQRLAEAHPGFEIPERDIPPDISK